MPEEYVTRGDGCALVREHSGGAVRLAPGTADKDASDGRFLEAVARTGKFYLYPLEGFVRYAVHRAYKPLQPSAPSADEMIQRILASYRRERSPAEGANV